MTDTDQLDLMLSALSEIIEEEKGKKASPPPPLAPALPSLGKILADISPLPREALFLGMANDGLPVLLNLYDPVPGPILIAGDSSSGKTRFLQTIARAVESLHAPDFVQYGVVTQKPDEWKGLYGNEHNAGIYRSHESNTVELIRSLVTWAHNNKGEGQSILLFIDELDDVTKLDEETRQNLRWLLLRGPSRRVWTFASLNATRTQPMTEWLEFFRTRLFGFVEDAENGKFLTGNSPLNHLASGEEFAMREGNQLLKFWLPTMD
jgi:hypothetical protein